MKMGYWGCLCELDPSHAEPAALSIFIHVFLTLPCFLGWAVSPLSVVLIHEFPHPSGAQLCVWNGHLPNNRPGSFTGTLQTICRLHSRTTSALQGATRTLRLAHIWLWKSLSAKGYKMLCTSSCRRNSPSEQELLHHLSKGQRGLPQEPQPQVLPWAPSELKWLPMISHGLCTKGLRKAPSPALGDTQGWWHLQTTCILQIYTIFVCWGGGFVAWALFRCFLNQLKYKTGPKVHPPTYTFLPLLQTQTLLNGTKIPDLHSCYLPSHPTHHHSCTCKFVRIMPFTSN